jgi:outer membrane lipoprotein SlyB
MGQAEYAAKKFQRTAADASRIPPITMQGNLNNLFGSRLGGMLGGTGTGAMLGGMIGGGIGAAAFDIGKSVLGSVWQVAQQEVERFNQSLERSVELTKEARKLDLKVEQWERIRRIAGDSAQDAAAGIKNLRKELGEARLTGDRKNFLALGLDPNKLAGMDPGEQLQTVAKRLMLIQNPSDRAAMSARMFGKSAQDLGPLLSELANERTGNIITAAPGTRDVLSRVAKERKRIQANFEAIQDEQAALFPALAEGNTDAAAGIIKANWLQYTTQALFAPMTLGATLAPNSFNPIAQAFAMARAQFGEATPVPGGTQGTPATPLGISANMLVGAATEGSREAYQAVAEAMYPDQMMTLQQQILMQLTDLNRKAKDHSGENKPPA